MPSVLSWPKGGAGEAEALWAGLEVAHTTLLMSTGHTSGTGPHAREAEKCNPGVPGGRGHFGEQFSSLCRKN